MANKSLFVTRLALGVAGFFLAVTPAAADWPMAGQNNQRTSYSSADTSPSSIDLSSACWSKKFTDYIPSKAHIITVDRGTTNSMVYVPTAAGVYALNALTGAQVWFYQTPLPVGHSPTVDKTTDTMYIPVLDKTIHAVNATTGVKKWQTLKAGGGFLTSPLVANNLVYAGNRDGYMYAFRTTDGSLAWSYQTGGPVDYSPAINSGNSVLYFASADSYAYALNALTGALNAKSVKFQGHGFYSFWPVVHPSLNRVLFARSLNYPDDNYIDENQRSVFPFESQASNSVAPFIAYHTSNPDRRSLQILDSTTLAEQEIAPYMWWGNPNGNRYPPAIDGNGTVWALSAWYQISAGEFPKGRYMGWKIGSNTFTPKPDLTGGDLESTDEPEAIAIFGGSIWHSDGGDGADKGGVASISTSNRQMWDPNSLYTMVGAWYSNWNLFRYGNGLVNQSGWAGIRGTHGNQNPPVPLRGKAYVHRSNTVICMQP